MADLQLLDDRVSREHAEIVSGPEASHWLVDMGSSNGTFVDDQPVGRVQLGLGAVFRVQDTNFIFEEEVPTLGEKDETFVVSYHGAPSRRGTIEYDARRIEEYSSARTTNSVAQRRSAKRHRVIAMYYDGLPYTGNVVEDIALYRALELRLARNELQSTQELDQLQKLASRLCLPVAISEVKDNRPQLYSRLSCCFPATLRVASGKSLSVAMVDLGVDGAQVLIYGHGVRRNEVVWLTVDLVTGQRRRTLVFTSHVSWTSSNHIGLAFSGERMWRDPIETVQQIDQILPSAGTLPADSPELHP